MWRHIVAIVSSGTLVALAAISTLMPARVEPLPLVAPLGAIPERLAAWTTSQAPIPDCAVPAEHGAADELVRTYRDDEHTVWVSVLYYSVQGRGLRPRAPELLMAGRGSIESSATSLDVPIGDAGGASIPATLVVTRTAACRIAMLYWYQLGTRAVASDHGYRAVLLYNRVVHQRADGALVRIASPLLESSSVASVVDAQKRFINAFYAELVRTLPR
jgi:EpsI family protein